MTGVVLGVIGSAACGPIAPWTGRVDIVAAGLIAGGGDRMMVDLELANGTDDAVFLYDAVRRVQHDAATKRTTLQLRSAPCGDNPAVDQHWLLPSSQQVAPLSYARLEIATFRSYHQLGSGDPIELGAVPVADAAALTVELAWTDRDFAEHGPGCLGDALLALERGVAQKTFTP